MPAIEERVSKLEGALEEFIKSVGIEFNKLYNAQMRAEAELQELRTLITNSHLRIETELREFREESEKDRKALHNEMKEFKDEMRIFREESEKDRKALHNEMKEFKDEMRIFREESEKDRKALHNEMKEFKDEMKEFKDEMKEFKDEMRIFREESEKDRKALHNEMKEFKDGTLTWRQTIDEERRRMARQWGELANKMGTLVEDIVLPNIPRLAKEYFGCEEIEDIMIRRKKINTKDRSKKREFDVIAVCNDKIVLNETKATPRTAYIDEFAGFLERGEFFDYFPEYKSKVIIPIFASLYIDDDIVRYLSQKRIYALGMKDDTMEILNPEF